MVMANTISRDELKQKIDRKDDFFLVETLPATAYHHAHLPGTIMNLSYLNHEFALIAIVVLMAVYLRE